MRSLPAYLRAHPYRVTIKPPRDPRSGIWQRIIGLIGWHGVASGALTFIVSGILMWAQHTWFDRITMCTITTCIWFGVARDFQRRRAHRLYTRQLAKRLEAEWPHPSIELLTEVEAALR